MHVVEEFSLPVLDFLGEVCAPVGWVDDVPIPMVSIDANVLTEIGQLVFRLQNVTSVFNFDKHILIIIYTNIFICSDKLDLLFNK